MSDLSPGCLARRLTDPKPQSDEGWEFRVDVWGAQGSPTNPKLQRVPAQHPPPKYPFMEPLWSSIVGI